jgi:uncharacterized protein (DUF2062 family)
MDGSGRQHDNRKKRPDAPMSLVASSLKAYSTLRRMATRPDLSSERVAWSFAIGFAISMNPIFLTQAAITVFLCLVLKNMHKPLLVLGSLICNPFTSLPINTFQLMFGNWMMGNGWTINFHDIPWQAIRWKELSLSTLGAFKPLLAPYLLGSMVSLVIALLTGYFSMYYFSKYFRERKRKRLARLQNL